MQGKLHPKISLTPLHGMNLLKPGKGETTKENRNGLYI